MKVVLGIPTVSGMPGRCLPGMLNLSAEIARVSETLLIPEIADMMPHSRARTEIFAVAEAANADFLVFVDADTLVPERTFERLLATLTATSAAMIAGHVYRRGWPYTPTWFHRQGDQTYQVTATEGRHELSSCGLACNLIDVKWVREHAERPFFQMGPTATLPFVWEDAWFCDRILHAGGKIIGDASVRCGHWHGGIFVNDDNAEVLRQMTLREWPSDAV